MVFKYVAKYKKLVFLSLFLITLIVSAALIQPLIINGIINDGILNVNAIGAYEPNMSAVNKYGLALIILAVVGLIAGITNIIIGARVSQTIGSDIRTDMFKKIQSFSYEDIEKFESSNLVVRLTNDVTQVQNLILMTFNSLVRIPLLFVGAFILAVITIPNLWWIIILLVVLYVVIQMFVLKITFPLFGKYQSKLDRINTIVKDNFVGIRVVKSFVQENKEINNISKESDELGTLTFSIGKNMSIIFPLFLFIGNASVILAIYFGLPLAEKNPKAIGDIIAFTNYLFQIMYALIIGGFMLMMAGRAGASLQRIAKVINYEPTMMYTNKVEKQLNESIEFDNVSFAYPNSKDLSLIDISFKVNAGERIGIVGATGSGKSTLAQLIARLFDPTSGNILIGNDNLKDISKSSLRNGMAIVLQKPQLFSGTIKENITQGNLNATDSLIEKSSKAAQAYEFISSTERGFDTEVLQRGANYSGGQKQRISISRGLVKEPDILILDDSTSALDAKSEALVKEALSSSYDSTTFFIISQKISSVVDADKIIVLDKGRIVGFDSHTNLTKTCEAYQEIFNTQKGEIE